MSRHMRSNDVKGLIDEVKEFFSQHDLGELNVYSLVPLTLIVKDDYDMSDVPDVGKTLCILNEGILEAVFDSRTGVPLRVTQSECFGIKSNYCKFVLEPTLYD